MNVNEKIKGKICKRYGINSNSPFPVHVLLKDLSMVKKGL
jgi:hypothetical protein